MATNNKTVEKEEKNIKIVKLNSYISYELLKKMKEKEPNTRFILPNGREAVLNAKEK